MVDCMASMTTANTSPGELTIDAERGGGVELREVGKDASTATATQAEGAASVEAVPSMDRATLVKLISVGYAFFCAGVNDGSLGPIIPYLLISYDIRTNLVAVVYGVTFCGWFFAALTNSHLTQYLDLGCMLVLGASMQLLAHVLRAWLPPYGLFAASFFFAHLGQAYQDAHANTWVSSVKTAHRWLGFIHAMYMAGCLVGPFIATAVAAANSPSKWYLFYTCPLGMCVVNVCLAGYAFRDRLVLKRKPGASETTSRNKGATKEIRETVRLPSVWLLSMFYFFYLATAITASGKFCLLHTIVPNVYRVGRDLSRRRPEGRSS
jgi:fucose permease